MSSHRPWISLLLGSLLPERDQETITGDLLEEYSEVILPAKGLIRAHCWYVEQIGSFLPQIEWFRFAARVVLTSVALFAIALFFKPAAGGIVFLLGGPLSGFLIARRSVMFYAGTIAALLAAAAMFSIFLAVGFPRPPGFATPILIAILLGTLGALLGRCSTDRIQEVVFPRLETATRPRSV
jgi:hypothetical protein